MRHQKSIVLISNRETAYCLEKIVETTVNRNKEAELLRLLSVLKLSKDWSDSMRSKIPLSKGIWRTVASLSSMIKLLLTSLWPGFPPWTGN